MENVELSSKIDYFKIEGLKKEAMQQLNRVKPLNLRQASEIYGVNPTDISVLYVWLKKNRALKLVK